MIESIQVIRKLKFWQRPDLIGGVVVHAMYIWVLVNGLIEQFELAILGGGFLLLLHALLLLSSEWSVAMRSIFVYKKAILASGAIDGLELLVRPKSGQGKLAIVPIKPHAPVTKAQVEGLINEDSLALASFEYNKNIFVLDDAGRFAALDYPSNNTIAFYLQWRGYAAEENAQKALGHWGKNEFDLSLPEFWDLYVKQLLSPMFIFQAFCMLLYCFDDYFYFSIITLVMLLFIESQVVNQRLKNFKELEDMKQKPHEVMTYRNRKWRKILSDCIVPGDIISISRSAVNQTLPCDVLLLNGSCIVNEALLTGESVPQLKEPISHGSYAQTAKLSDLGEQSTKLHMVYSGTEVVQMAQQSSAPGTTPFPLSSPEHGCVGFVMRTGFQTEQGRLLAAIVSNTEQMSANNTESMTVIAFLLVFALTASSYVWTQSVGKRSYYKLAVHCMLIITSVVPPDLPVQLSLAVNQSLMAIKKIMISCTEPFRIPYAGKVDVCCFDKTGTLTTSSIDVVGIAGLEDDIIVADELGQKYLPTTQALAACQSLALMSGQLVGDPLEIATVGAIHWSVGAADTATDTRLPGHNISIIKRFHFNSELKRMSVVLSAHASERKYHMVAAKGAPEIIKKLLVQVPEFYDEIAKKYTCQGARVLTIAFKIISHVDRVSELYHITREQAESELIFGGFLVVSSPMKQDSAEAIAFLRDSAHHAVMITGDNPLTACFVAKELNIIDADALILTAKSEQEYVWQSADETIVLPLQINRKALREICQDWCLCLSGPAITFVQQTQPTLLPLLITYVDVFARVSPDQKAIIIECLNHLGAVTLMCGDGTNDVAALKKSHVGLAIVPGTHKHKAKRQKKAASTTATTGTTGTGKGEEKKEGGDKVVSVKDKMAALGYSNAVKRPPGAKPARDNKPKKVESLEAKIWKTLESLQEESTPKLGDASTAAPFVSKSSSILGVCNLIRQGRCTLVITLQMIIILALNSLLTSYSMSVLFLDGVKISDMQMTVQALFLVTCIMMISQASPLDILSRERPYGHVLHPYAILTILSQFGIHIWSMIYVCDSVRPLESRPPITIENEDEKFKMTLMNSAVYVLTLAMQIVTFVVNYRGHPFMLSLMDNKGLFRTLIAAEIFLMMLISGLFDFRSTLSVEKFPAPIRNALFITVFSDLALSFGIDRLLRFVFRGATSSRISKLR